MKRNLGKIDKIIRIVLAVVLAAFGYYYSIWWLYIFAAAVLITALIGHCCLYTLIGISTCPVKKHKKAKKEKK